MNNIIVTTDTEKSLPYILKGFLMNPFQVKVLCSICSDSLLSSLYFMSV